MENAHEYLCQEKSKRIDPMVKFLSNITEAEKKQVNKDIANSTFNPDHPQTREHLDTKSEKCKLCSHATLSRNSTKDKRKVCKAEKSRAWNEVAEPRIGG